MSATDNTPVEVPPEASFKAILPCVFFTSGMFFLCYLDRAIFGPLLPQMEAEFSITHAQSTRALLYIAAGYAVSVLISGFVASFIKARYLAGLAVVACGGVLFLIALAPGWSTLLPLFVLLGLAAGQYFNGGMGVLRSMVPTTRWGFAISIHELGPSLSFVISPLLAQAGAGHFGWRGVAAGMGVVSVIAGLAYIFLGKGGQRATKRFSPDGVRRMVTNPRLWLFAWFMALGIAGEFAPFSVMTMHLTEDRNMTAEGAAALLSASRTIAPAAVLLGGWLTWRFGSQKALMGCFFFYAAGMFMLASPWFGLMVVGLFLQPVVTALIFPPLFTMMVEAFPPEDQALLLSFSMPAAGIVGSGLMPSLLGYAGDHFSFTAGFALLGLMLVLTLPLVPLMKRKNVTIP